MIQQAGAQGSRQANGMSLRVLTSKPSSPLSGMCLMGLTSRPPSPLVTTTGYMLLTIRWYEFDGTDLEISLPTEQRTTCVFKTNRDAKFDGVHLHLRVVMDDTGVRRARLKPMPHPTIPV